jgi:hypothetical protein
MAEPPESSKDDAGQPWVLRLGNYLTQPKSASTENEVPWTVRLGTYLNEQKPGPWSLIANEKPQDPLVCALTNPFSL